MKQLTITILIFTILLYSCDKTVNIPIPDNGRKLVVNSFFQSGNNLTVNLSKSKYILDNSNSNDAISNAEISLFENNILLEKLIETEPGKYKSTFFLLENKEYSIFVNSNNFDQVKAFNKIPLLSTINNFKFINYTIAEYGDQEINFTIEFDDDLNTEGFYLIELFKEFNYYEYNSDTDQYDIETKSIEKIYISSKDPGYGDEKYNNSGILLDDKLFNGKNHSFSFYAYAYSYYYKKVNKADDKEKYYVHLSTISKDYYLYINSLNKHLNTQGDFFSEPVQVYGNIENGFGIFAGFSSSIDSVEVAPYVY